MSGLSNAINNALSGLEAFETGISVVSNNISNAQTNGYASESVDIQEASASSGQIGQGVVNPVEIIRAASGFAASQLRGANTANAAATAQSTSLTSISNALTNNGNIQTAISQFFSDISSLAANPSSTALRQTILSDAQGITASFQSATSNISSVIAGAQEGLSNGVTAANGLLAQLQTINQSLGQNPNSSSLLDQQHATLNSLSEYLPVNVIPQSNGSIVVTSGGTILLDQSGAQKLSISSGQNGNTTIEAGVAKALVTLLESDGSLGANIATITSGNQAQQSLNVIAASLATQINQSQAEGLNESGDLGSNLFSISGPEITASSNNTGDAKISASIVNTGDLPADGGPFTLTYSSANGWSAVDQMSGQTYQATGIPPTLAGLALSVSGTVQNGDCFTLNPAPNAASSLSVAATSTGSIAAADPYVATPGVLQSNGSISNENGGTITVGADNIVSQLPSGVNAVPASEFGADLQVTFNASTSPASYTITNPQDSSLDITGQLTSSGSGSIYIQYPTDSNASGKYWELQFTASPDNGDSLTLQPGGTSSGSNAQRMASLWSATNTTTSGTLEQSVVGLATGLGSNASAAQQLATATSTQVATTTQNLAAVAGVDTDKQAVLLTNYQQAYQAAAQVISSVHSMFESLLSAV